MTLRKRKQERGEGAPEPAGLGGEIELLRGLLRRALALAAALEEGDAERQKELLTLLRVLDSLSRSAARTGRMLVSQRELEGDGLLGEALREATERAMRRLAGQEGDEHGPG
jgi:hypothetical protein